MLKFTKLAVIASIAALLAAPALADDKIVATVNGVDIPQSRLDQQVQNLASQGQPDTPELRKALLERMINFELLAQKSVKDGYDKQPEVKEQLELARKTVLVQSMIEDFNKNHPISEDKVRAEYDKLKDQPGNKRYNIAHIMVISEGDAKKVEAQLKKGANFATVARKYSKDPTAKTNGGQMGWHTASEFMPDFAEAMIHLQKGQVSAPVKTEGGWHIIKVIDVQNIPFEDVKQNLLQQLQAKAVQKMVKDLRDGAKIEEHLK